MTAEGARAIGAVVADEADEADSSPSPGPYCYFLFGR